VPACSFLDGQGSKGSLAVNRDVVQEIVVGFRKILALENPSGFFTGQPALHRGCHHPDGGLRTKNFKEIGVGDKGSLVEVQGFGCNGSLLKFAVESIHAVCRK